MESRGKAVINSGDRTNYPGGKVKFYFWHLEAPNGEIIAQSEIYQAKQSAKEVLEKYFPEFEIVDAT